MMRSLRTRLLIGMILGIMLLLGVFSLIVYTVTRSALIRQFDGSLASIAHVLAASIEYDPGDDKIELEFEVRQMPEFQSKESLSFYQLWSNNGKVLAKSPLLKTDDLARPEGPLNTIVFAGPQQKSGRSLREIGLSFVPRSAENDEVKTGEHKVGQSLTLAIARDAGGLYGQLQFLRRLLLIASGAVIVLSLLIAAIIVRKGLNPLNSIAAEIATITEDSLATRITAENVPTEVMPIKNSINELMSRIEASFNRERKFNADVAHELRTPLAGLLSTIEVTLARDRDSSDYKQALTDCLEITGNMQAVVANLLMLSRIEARQIDLKTERIRLAELVDSLWKPFLDKALGRNVSFENQLDSNFTLESDRSKLGTVLSNLLGNAAEYVNDGGRIWIAAGAADGSVEIAVSNTGCNLTAEQVEQVFDCFWRADLSRSDTGAHCGLGLALVQRLMGALGGRAVAKIKPDGIFTVLLIFPEKS